MADVIPGGVEVELQCLVGSNLPNEIAGKFGFPVSLIGETERILPGAIVERFTTVNGELVRLTEGSTRPVAEIRTHVGICKVTRYGFNI